MKFFLICLCLIVCLSGANAQEYEQCMHYCVPEHGFDSCNTLKCDDAGLYDYGVCMEHCVPEHGFDSCNILKCLSLSDSE